MVLCKRKKEKNKIKKNNNDTWLAQYLLKRELSFLFILISNSFDPLGKRTFMYRTKDFSRQQIAFYWTTYYTILIGFSLTVYTENIACSNEINNFQKKKKEEDFPFYIFNGKLIYKCYIFHDIRVGFSYRIYS